MTVRNVFEEIRQQGLQIGEKQGEARGIQIGEKQGEARGIQIGEARGIAQGGLHMLFSLVGDGLLPLAAAAAKAKMSEEEFRARMLAQEKSKDS